MIAEHHLSGGGLLAVIALDIGAVPQNRHQVTFQPLIADIQPQPTALPGIAGLRDGELSVEQRNADAEQAAQTRFGLDGDIAVHQVDQFLTDSQPQAGSWKWRCTPVPTWKNGSNRREISFSGIPTPVSRTLNSR